MKLAIQVEITKCLQQICSSGCKIIIPQVLTNILTTNFPKILPLCVVSLNDNKNPGTTTRKYDRRDYMVTVKPIKIDNSTEQILNLYFYDSDPYYEYKLIICGVFMCFKSIYSRIIM